MEPVQVRIVGTAVIVSPSSAWRRGKSASRPPRSLRSSASVGVGAADVGARPSSDDQAGAGEGATG